MYRSKGFYLNKAERAAYFALQAAALLFPFRANCAPRTGTDLKAWEQGISHAALLIVFETGLCPSQARALAISVLQKPWFD